MRKNKLVLSTGRSLYAFYGVIGIGPDLKTFHGFDGGFPEYMYDEEGSLIFEGTDFAMPTTEEMLEVCAIMLKRWAEKRDELKKEKGSC